MYPESIEYLKVFSTYFTIVGGGCAAFTIFIYMGKYIFRKGEIYQLFKNLVQRVESIEEMINNKFIDAAAMENMIVDKVSGVERSTTEHAIKLQNHDKRITKIEDRYD